MYFASRSEWVIEPTLIWSPAQPTERSASQSSSVSPALLWTGVKWALAIGFVGGLLPAVRAARLPVTTALRES